MLELVLTEGSEAHNLRLSKQRADVVAEYLVSNGVDIKSIETFGLPVPPHAKGIPLGGGGQRKTHSGKHNRGRKKEKQAGGVAYT